MAHEASPDAYALPVRIELLYWDGCPSHPEALALLEDVMRSLEIDEPVSVVEVTSDADAHRLAFPGSPTIRVDGHDVDPIGSNGRPALTCRIYRTPEGKISPVPSRRQVEEALR
ncbi:unannotated protein [freshwater metagenome]|uniref:Unannotated protein n=1 Tax=freshwater metagenome TaxID=449393 RepID=A0A6J6QD15_9ZZZZ